MRPLIHGHGTPEPVWRAWLAGQHFAPAAVASVVPPGCRLVVVAPHPDDEILACGGLLAACTRRHAAVLVIALTDGDASHSTHDPLAMHELALKRRAESVKGLGVLGLSTHDIVRWHIPDGHVRKHQAQITTALTRLLKPLDVVVTTWSMDGHPDHEAAGEAVSVACTVVGCSLLQAPVWMWHWAMPGDARVPRSQVVAVVASAETADLKQQALACHHSQLSEGVQGQAPILGAAICARAAWPVEYFFVASAVV